MIGLTSAEVIELRKQYGFNDIPEEKKHPLLKFLVLFLGPDPVDDRDCRDSVGSYFTLGRFCHHPSAAHDQCGCRFFAGAKSGERN